MNVFLKPFFSDTFAFQPYELANELSINFRGVPFGLLLSNFI